MIKAKEKCKSDKVRIQIGKKKSHLLQWLWEMRFQTKASLTFIYFVKVVDLSVLFSFRR